MSCHSCIQLKQLRKVEDCNLLGTNAYNLERTKQANSVPNQGSRISIVKPKDSLLHHGPIQCNQEGIL